MFRIIYCFILVSILYSPLYAVDFWQATKLYGGYTQPVAFAPNGDIYIGTHRGGIFSSSDDGRTWQPVNHKTFFFQQLAFDTEGRLWGARWATPGLGCV